jgi:hypothetical protein
MIHSCPLLWLCRDLSFLQTNIKETFQTFCRDKKKQNTIAMNKTSATASSEAGNSEAASSDHPSIATRSSDPSSSKIPESTQQQHRARDPKRRSEEGALHPLVMVEYLHCCQCSESSMLLTKPEPEDCDYCGHHQCVDCDEWVNFEWTSCWFEKC